MSKTQHTITFGLTINTDNIHKECAEDIAWLLKRFGITDVMLSPDEIGEDEVIALVKHRMEKAANLIISNYPELFPGGIV